MQIFLLISVKTDFWYMTAPKGHNFKSTEFIYLFYMTTNLKTVFKYALKGLDSFVKDP